MYQAIDVRGSTWDPLLCPIMDDSEEWRGRIEQWNQEKEQAELDNKANVD